MSGVSFKMRMMSMRMKTDSRDIITGDLHKGTTYMLMKT